MKTKLGTILLLWITGFASAPPAKADTDYVLVALTEINFVLREVFDKALHLADIAKYVQMVDNQVQQINQLTSIVNQSVEQLKRFGDPGTYINMLDLDQLLSEVGKINNGVGKTVADFQQIANGMAAIKNTSMGLYQDLSSVPDRFGQQIQYNADSFKKFGVVQDMYQDYGAEVQQANNSLRTLQNEKARTLEQLNAASSLVEVQKLQGKLQAVQASLDNVLARATASAQKVLVQTAANTNDDLRRAEAVRQQRAQEAMTEDLHLQKAGAAILGPESNEGSRP